MLKALCSSDGMYLVTGGLGALGIGIARWLVGHGARHVMLTGRSAFPERASWPGLAAEGDRRAAGLLDLEKSGAKFTIVRADASDYEAMNKALSGAGMALKGIVHAAGTVTPKEVLELEAADIESDMRAKVAGAWVLHQLSQRHRPDFFIMFSSASAIWGSKLLAGYGAANHFLDGLAQMRRGMGQPALSVNWAMWGDGGMAIGGGHDRMLMRMGMRPMPPVKAFAVLDELAGAGDAQAAVADVDWSVLKPLYEQGPRRRLLELIKFAGRGEGPEGRGPQGGESGLLASIRANPDPDAVKAAVAGFVIRQAAEVLGVPPEKVDATKPLTAQGLDSLNAGELRGRIQKTLNVRIDVLSLLKGDSPEQVGWRVMEKLSGALAEASAGPDAETLDDDIRAAGAEPAHEGAPREILLTGATGFLGVHMLADLLGRTGARVHCLVKAVRDTEAMDRVRSKMEEAGLWRSGMMGRLSAVAGDLSQPRLGLTSARWDLLARSVDVIHHAGYAVNFLFSYEDMRAANVLSLKELLRLAAGPRVKPVHFVSSFSVLLTREYAGKSIGDYETLFPAEGGYREGKRACERLIGEARRRGVPVGIYRPPFIGWRGDTGYYNERDFLIKLMRGCIDLGSAPDLDILFYITPVDYIASSIIRLSLEPSAANGNFNVLSSPRGLPWKDLVGLLRQAGAAIEIEPFALWREKLDKAGPSNPLHVFFPALGADVEERGSAVLDLFSAGSAPSEIRLDGLRKFLGDPPPETAVDEELVRAFVERVKKG
jgi:thioester reductase-like protein